MTRRPLRRLRWVGGPPAWGRGMMKAVQWRQGMMEHVVPHLPGQWRARKTLISALGLQGG